MELLNILGFDPAKGIPSIPDYLSLVHPDDRPSAEATIKRMIAEGIGCDLKKRIVRKDGAPRVARCVGVPVFEGGKVARFIGTLMDITEQEQMTQELRCREAHLTQAEALSRTGSFRWNVSTGDLSWSDENFRILEYERTVKPTLELVFKRFHPEDAATVQRTIERASKDAKNLDFEHRLLMPNGSIKHVRVLARPFKDQSGNVEFLGAVMDVTATKKAFQEIKALKDELYKENIVLREEVDKTSMFEEVVGASLVLRAVLARASKVAPTDSTVLITGETGTGKELFARAIHKRSQRSTRAFVSVNCAAIPPSLITSELFGHEKGAFTGAIQRRLGRFELAEGGTLFLDEIGELPVETQIALLRILQEREFERVGGTEPLRADVRVIAATNRDLQGAITAGTFRSDLFYRLNVFPITLPPLRERKEDIPPLVSYFVDRFAKRELAFANETSIESADLPARKGPRPQTIRGPLHIQCNGHGDSRYVNQLVGQVLTWPHIESTPTSVSPPDTIRIRLAEIATDEPSAFLTPREFGRVLLGVPTIYLALPLVCAHWAIVRGWAEPHYLASFGLMPAGAVVVYTPRDEQELEVCYLLFSESYRFGCSFVRKEG